MYRFISLKHVYTFMNEKRDENELFQMGNVFANNFAAFLIWARELQIIV